MKKKKKSRDLIQQTLEKAEVWGQATRMLKFADAARNAWKEEGTLEGKALPARHEQPLARPKSGLGSMVGGAGSSSCPTLPPGHPEGQVGPQHSPERGRLVEPVSAAPPEGPAYNQHLHPDDTLWPDVPPCPAGRALQPAGHAGAAAVAGPGHAGRSPADSLGPHVCLSASLFLRHARSVPVPGTQHPAWADLFEEWVFLI